MEWLDKLNESIEYIEDNLEGDIEYEKATKLASLLHLSFSKNVFLYSWCNIIRIYKK